MTAAVETVRPERQATTASERTGGGAALTRARRVAAKALSDSSRLAGVALTAAAIAYWLQRARGIWFPGDDWYALAGRSLGVDGLLEQHAGHLIALPVVVYRTLYWAFGVRSYTPYLLVTVALHVTIAWQLRSLMLRAGVGHWIATPFVAVWLFFGPGATNVVFAFQMTLAGSLALGLLQLQLADHDGARRRRDAIAALVGVAAVACSGVGVATVAAVGMSVLIRRGARAAALQVLPAAAAYGMWSASAWSNSDSTYPRSADVWFRWVWESIRGAVLAIGGSLVPALIIAGLFVGGAILIVRERRAGDRGQLAAPIGLAVGAIAVSALTSSRAWLGYDQASASRYVGIVAPLLLPIVAVTTQRVVSRAGRHAAIVRAIVFGVAVAAVLSNLDAGPVAPKVTLRAAFASAPRHPLAATTPSELAPAPTAAPAVTIGWLRDALAAGRLPAAPPGSPALDATNVLRLSVRQRAASRSTLARLGIPHDARTTLDVATNGRCRRLTNPRSVSLRPGEPVVLLGTAMIRALPPTVAIPSHALPFGTVLVYTEPGPKQLDAVRGPVILQLYAGRGTLCA